MKLSRTTALATTALVALGGLVLPPAPAGAAERPASEDLVGFLASTRWFSPDGDGVQDRVRVLIPVKERAQVTVLVRRIGDGTVVRRARLGTLRAGQDRVWGWRGRDDRGAPVADGDFRVVVRAARKVGRHTETDVKVTRVRARTTYSPGPATSTFALSRDTLYPATTDFTDNIFLDASYYRAATSLGGTTYRGAWAAALEVRAADGSVVRSWPESRVPATRTWDGTAQNGSRVPAGTYTLVMAKRDSFGNREQQQRTITVSDAKLVAQPAWTTTVGAAAALVNREVQTSACPPKASTRVAGGVTLLSPAAAGTAWGTTCTTSSGTFGATPPFTLDAMDRVTVTATGSTFPADGTGTARLWLDATPVDPVTTAPSSSQTLLGQSTLGATVLREKSRVSWIADGANLGTTEYDLSSFEVQVVHYAPQP